MSLGIKCDCSNMNQDAIVIEGSCEPAEVITISKEARCIKCGSLVHQASFTTMDDLLNVTASHNELCPACSKKNVGGDLK